MEKTFSYPLVLLAAGQSSRRASPKGLSDFHGKPWILEQLKNFALAGGKRAVVVLGYDAEKYFEAVPSLQKARAGWIEAEGLNVGVAVNEHPEHGQFSSLQSGLTALAGLRDLAGPGALGAAVFVAPVDIPLAYAQVWQALSEKMTEKIFACIPTYDGKGGHPVLISKNFAERIAGLPSEGAASRLDVQLHALSPAESVRLPVRDERVIRNLNSPEEWNKFVSEFRA